MSYTLHIAEEIELTFDHLTPAQWKTLVKELRDFVKENGMELSTHFDDDKILAASHRTVEMPRMGFRNGYGLEELLAIFSRYLDEDQALHVDTMSDQGEKGYQQPQMRWPTRQPDGTYVDNDQLHRGPEYSHYEVRKGLVRQQRLYCVMHTEYASDGKVTRGWPIDNPDHWLKFQELADALNAFPDFIRDPATDVRLERQRTKMLSEFLVRFARLAATQSKAGKSSAKLKKRKEPTPTRKSKTST